MHHGRIGLLDLPAELLFEILAYSTSSYLPLANKYLLHTFHHAPPSCRAYFILGRFDPSAPLGPEVVLTGALSYPMCTGSVLDFLEHIYPLALLSRANLKAVRVSPGRWMFRGLQSQPKPKRRRKHGSNSATALLSPSSACPRANPLAFLESLESRYTLWFSTNESAFALAMCVRAGPAQHPLLQLLLRNGADPSAKSCLPLQIAATLGVSLAENAGGWRIGFSQPPRFYLLLSEKGISKWQSGLCMRKALFPIWRQCKCYGVLRV